uniref:NAD(P)-binding protein n=1 Tax=Syphacia muris TaxID=451379 RepID=A0A0N5AMT7_9BILA
MERIPANILITGARRGIGLGLVKGWAKYDAVKNIFACARKLEDDDELGRLAETDPRIHFIKMDVNNDRDICYARSKVQEIIGEDNGLNLLINNARLHEKCEGSTFFGADRKIFAEHFETNVTSQLRVASFYPLLKKASDAVTTTTALGAFRAAILNVCSVLGSIELNSEGSMFIKNIMSKTMALDFVKDRILVTAIFPGWANTSWNDSATEVNDCFAVLKFYI